MNQEPVHIIFLKVKIMTYENFREEFINRIKSYLPPEYEFWKSDLHTVHKVNCTLDGFSLIPVQTHPERSAYPVFYIQDLFAMYESGVDLDSVLTLVADMIVNLPVPTELQDMGVDISEVKESIVVQLINCERNQELLREHPHRNFMDLAAVYRLLTFNEERGWSGMLVTNSLMKEWNMTEEDLYEIAWKNTPELLPFQLKTSGRIFQSGVVLEENQNRFCILTNEHLMYGAATMLYTDVLEMAAAQLGGSYLILPGSMHELYLTRESCESASSWKEAVYLANRELVELQDILSDNVYYYDCMKKTINVL